MLKALKTLLKDDIINPNTWRIKYGNRKIRIKGCTYFDVAGSA